MRKTVARVASLLLALAAMLAFGDSMHAPSSATGHASSIAGARGADDVHAIVAIPARAADWATTQLRGPQGNDKFVATLLAGALLVVALVWRRAMSLAILE